MVDWLTASAILQAIAAAFTAGFTFTLLKFTKSSWRISVRNARSARKSADAARDAVLITHRGKVKIRAISVDVSETWEIVAPLKGRLIAVNSGAIDATLTHYFVKWLIAPRLPMRNPSHSAPGEVPPQNIDAGAFIRLDFADNAFSDRDCLRSMDPSSGVSLFVFGYIKYRDAKDTLRRTFFGYRYDKKLGRFTKEDNPDYNYTD